MYCECNSHPGFWRLSTHPTPPPKKVNWYSLYKEQHGGSLKKKRNLKSEFPYDPAIPLLGICPEKSLIWKDTRTLMFITEVFTKVKTWKLPKGPLTDEWIKNMWYINTYIGTLLNHKKEWNKAICSNVDGPRDDPTKWSQSEREIQVSFDSTYMRNQQKSYKRTYLQNKSRLTGIENKFMVTKKDNRAQRREIK